MLLDSVQRLRKLHDRFEDCLNSPAQEVSFPAITTGEPAPYEEFLGGLRVRKNEGTSSLAFANDGCLALSAPSRELHEFCKTLLVEEDGAHHHWYTNPVAFIIGADDWKANSES